MRWKSQITDKNKNEQSGKNTQLMNLKRTSIAILAVAGLLALSPAGRAQTNTPPGAAGRQGGGGRGNAEAQLTRYKEQLKLTDAQTPKVKAVIEERTKKMQELRGGAGTPEERRTKMQALMEEETKKMKEILTADQFKKYEEMQQQVRGRAGNRRQGGAGGNAGGAGGGQQQQ
jgi:Spy/CpxP family protein refolding chaperone